MMDIFVKFITLKEGQHENVLWFIRQYRQSKTIEWLQINIVKSR